jgi:hypothetical protein
MFEDIDPGVTVTRTLVLRLPQAAAPSDPPA